VQKYDISGVDGGVARLAKGHGFFELFKKNIFLQKLY
jgi:hypothetical protein